MDANLNDETRPYLSVILPVFNSKNYLSIAIESILNQTFVDFELIIIDDGSTDDSSKIIKHYVGRDQRIRLVERENKGLVYSLNEAINLAKGIYIARMDSDDISHPSRFEAQIAILEKEGADVCGCHYNVISGSNKKLIPVLCPLQNESVILYLSASTVPFAHGSVMMRRSFLLNNSLLYTVDSLAEDFNLWIRFFAHNAKFANADNFLFSYRIHIKSITGNKSKLLRKEGNNLSKLFLKSHLTECESAYKTLLFQELTELEEVLLIIASFRLFLTSGKLTIWKALKKASIKSKIIAIFKLLSGRT